jgi:hypothetical protein
MDRGFTPHTKIFVRKTKGTRPLGRHMNREEERNYVDLKEVGHAALESCHLGQHPVAGFGENCNEQSCSMKGSKLVEQQSSSQLFKDSVPYILVVSHRFNTQPLMAAAA